MTFTETLKQILASASEPLTPQEIREIIKEDYKQFYATDSHIKNVENKHYQNLDHALLAQIYSLVRTNDLFNCDKNYKPMKVSLIDSSTDINPIVDDYENDQGIVYVLKTDTFNKDGKEIIKIGFTTQDLNIRINQLYTTGVPFKFKIYKTYSTKNYIELEQALHKLLSPFKINKTREFFTDESIPFIDKIVEIHEMIQKEA